MPKYVFQPNTTIKSAEVNANFDGAYDGSLDTPANSLATFKSEFTQNAVISGLVIPTSANLSATTSSGVAQVNGVRVAVNATAKTYTASKDTYVDIKTDGTYAYVEVANGATVGMTLTSGSFRLAKVVTSGTAVTSVVQSASDPLGNEINPSPPGVWKTYAVGWGGITVGSSTVIARYTRIGRFIAVRWGLTFGGGSDVTGSVSTSVPIWASSNYNGFFAIGSAMYHDAGTQVYHGTIALESQLTARWFAEAASGNYVTHVHWSTTLPFDTSTVNGDQFQGSGIYEAANA